MFRKPAFLSVIVLLLASALHADGKYWPERAIAAEPSIPLQRALITYRDGSETLIVESTFDSPSPPSGGSSPCPANPPNSKSPTRASSGPSTSVSSPPSPMT